MDQREQGFVEMFEACPGLDVCTVFVLISDLVKSLRTTVHTSTQLSYDPKIRHANGLQTEHAAFSHRLFVQQEVFDLPSWTH